MEQTKGFVDTLSAYRHRVDQTLEKTIRAAYHPSSRLQEAMLYATLNGGKRLRPLLVYAAGESLGQTADKLDLAAAAMECIHCCSLIHDDLPAMDDDELRRGKPTCHIAFDEATAILAGDALQNFAFELLASPNNHLSPAIQLRLIQILSLHSGASGMISGQSLDLLAEGKMIATDKLEQIHRLKTGALIRASVLMGAVAGGCDENTLRIYDQFAMHIGLAFQLQDDLLDVIGNREKLGKNTGQDSKNNKATYTILLGVEKTQARIVALMQNAHDALHLLPHDAAMLNMLCDYVMKREC